MTPAAATGDTVAGRRGHAILVVDPVPLYARGMHAALADEPAFAVEVASPDPAKLVGAATSCDADVVVVGIRGEANEWLRACARLRRRQPRARVIVLADPGLGLDMSDVVRAGVTGVLLRSATEAEVVAAVHATLAGRSLIAPEVASAMMSALSAAVSRVDARSSAGGLSARELDVLRLVAEGMSNRNISARLHISENTVKNHMRRIHEKLGVRSRTEAVVAAVKAGLLGLGQPQSGLGQPQSG